MTNMDMKKICKFCCPKCNRVSEKKVQCYILRYRVDTYMGLVVRMAGGVACSDWCAEFLTASTMMAMGRCFGLVSAERRLEELAEERRIEDEEYDERTYGFGLRELFA
jgi:hypothetical protein